MKLDARPYSCEIGTFCAYPKKRRRCVNARLPSNRRHSCSFCQEFSFPEEAASATSIPLSVM